MFSWLLLHPWKFHWYYTAKIVYYLMTLLFFLLFHVSSCSLPYLFQTSLPVRIFYLNVILTWISFIAKKGIRMHKIFFVYLSLALSFRKEFEIITVFTSFPFYLSINLSLIVSWYPANIHLFFPPFALILGFFAFI